MFSPVYLDPTSAEALSAFRSALAVHGFGIEGTGGGNSAAVRRYYRENGDLWFTAVLTDGDLSAPCFGACELSVFATTAEGEEGNVDEYLDEGPEVDFVLGNLRAGSVPVVLGGSACYEVHTWNGEEYCLLRFPDMGQAIRWASAWVMVNPLNRFSAVEYDYTRRAVFGNEEVC